MSFDTRKAFQDLCARAYAEVRTDSDSTSTVTRLKGYFANQANRRVKATGETLCLEFVGRAVSFGITHIPFVGPALSGLADMAMRKAASEALKKDIEFKQANNLDAMQEKGELLVSTITQKYCDAFRKYEAAKQEAKEATPGQGQHFKNCSEVGAYLRKVYYWRFRMARLHFYHDQMMAYCNVVAAELKTAEHGFLAFQGELQSKGPAMFANWQWHYANCTEECYWPEPFAQEISKVTNAAESRDRLLRSGVRVYPATAFRGYGPNGEPLLAAPRVLPRPPQRGPMPPPYPPPKT